MTRRRSARSGFTLIELMVSAALAMLLLAGAFEMHAAFNRQNVRQQEIADMQQALRVATQVIGRAVRDAGTGMFGGTAQYSDLPLTGLSCPVPTGVPPLSNNPIDANENCLWPVQYSNRMPHVIFKNTFDTTAVGDVDPDDDWLRIVSFDADKAVRVDPTNAAMVAAGGAKFGQLGVTDTRFFTVGGFFFLSNTLPAYPDGNGKPTLGWRTGCLRQATSTVPAPNPNGPVPTPGVVVFAPNVFNPTRGGTDPCVDSAFQWATIPQQSRNVYVFPVDRSVVFQIQPGSAGPPATAPQLQAWYGSSANPVWMPASQPDFRTLTENLEHMQIALVLNDGTVCGNANNSVDSPALCNFQNVRSVRLTLVARSTSRWPGWLSQGVGGQWEDFNQPAANDGYLRRTLTTEIQIRNDPWGVQ